jgi:hypothetical protein
MDSSFHVFLQPTLSASFLIPNVLLYRSQLMSLSQCERPNSLLIQKDKQTYSSVYFNLHVSGNGVAKVIETNEGKSRVCCGHRNMNL